MEPYLVSVLEKELLEGLPFVVPEPKLNPSEMYEWVEASYTFEDGVKLSFVSWPVEGASEGVREVRKPVKVFSPEFDVSVPYVRNVCERIAKDEGVEIPGNSDLRRAPHWSFYGNAETPRGARENLFAVTKAYGRYEKMVDALENFLYEKSR